MTKITSLSDTLKIADDEYNKLTKEGGSFYLQSNSDICCPTYTTKKACLKTFDQKFLKGNFEDNSIY